MFVCLFVCLFVRWPEDQNKALTFRVFVSLSASFKPTLRSEIPFFLTQT